MSLGRGSGEWTKLFVLRVCCFYRPSSRPSWKRGFEGLDQTLVKESLCHLSPSMFLNHQYKVSGITLSTELGTITVLFLPLWIFSANLTLLQQWLCCSLPQSTCRNVPQSRKPLWLLTHPPRQLAVNSGILLWSRLDSWTPAPSRGVSLLV